MDGACDGRRVRQIKLFFAHSQNVRGLARRQESVTECEKARQNDPNVKINSSALNAYLYLGDYEKFLASLPEKDSAYILFYRGLAEYYLDRREEAVAHFDRAYLLDPSLMPARVGKALSESLAGRHDAAVKMVRQTQDAIEGRGWRMLTFDTR